MPSNSEFLEALFGEDAPWVHVTDFTHDPDHIPPGQELRAWRGNYFSRYRFQPISNQYFTISNFYADENDQARRRKNLYRHTPVIVLDDVKEKLSLAQVGKLPLPSWIMETSPGSEQWGYILDVPCTERARVENLLDGLVANGLAPDGKDPGMKGVTRYVRLPDGYNTKRKKMIDGKPFKVRLVAWQPFNRVSIEDLAKPFGVNLDAVRRESRVDGAAQIDDHPLLNIPDIIHIKEVRSNGRFDITCPWVDEHTDHVDNGAAIFTNGDGSIGFKCHHGSCQERTGKNLLEVIESDVPGFQTEFNAWKMFHAFSAVRSTPSHQSDVAQPAAGAGAPAPTGPAVVSSLSVDDQLRTALAELRTKPFTAPEARELASKVLQVTDTLPAMDRQHWQEEVRDYMHWNKSEFKNILKSLREEWYVKSKTTMNFFEEVIFVGELNQFYDINKNMFYSPEAYQNTYAHLSAEARKEALQGGYVMKVDKIDYVPKKPAIFTEGFIRYGNTWTDSSERHGVDGEITEYINHFDLIGWGPHRKHIMQFMAFTLRHPDQKINHMLILGSAEGAGKDFILAPLIRALGKNSRTIHGDELLGNFNDYLMGTKHLHINEVELGDHNEARTIANRLKPLTAAPPHLLRVNQKGIKPIDVHNLFSVTMCTNSPIPLNFKSPTRRAYALWTDFTTRDEDEETMPEWSEYWARMWEWMDNGGDDAVIHYLRNYVDLEGFNAGAPPPMTEFLREIRMSSESPAQQTVRAFIENKIGAFDADLCTAQEMSDTLRNGMFLAPGLCYMKDMLWFTPVKIGNIMREFNIPHHSIVESGRKNIFIIRNRSAYRAMNVGDLAAQYALQSGQAKLNTKDRLRVVK